VPTDHSKSASKTPRGNSNKKQQQSNTRMCFGSKANYGGNKENTDEYPTLGNPSKSLGNVFRQVNSPASGPSTSGASFSSNLTASRNMPTKPKSAKSNKFNTSSASDFPSLAGGGPVDMTGGNTTPRNYSGMSKVSVPMGRPQDSSLTNGTSNPKLSTNKKKKNSTRPEQMEIQSMPSSKKKTVPKLSNIFDDSDEENVFTASKEGEYTSYAPSASSNIKLITREQIENRNKKSQFDIGSSKPVPRFNSKDAFPSLGGGGNSSHSSNDMETSWGSGTSSNGNKKAKVNKNSSTDRTFHSSQGDSFSVPKAATNGGAKKEKNKKIMIWRDFIHPEEFHERNKNLIKMITNECGNSSNKFEK